MENTLTEQKAEIEASEHARAKRKSGPIPEMYIAGAQRLFARAPQNPILTSRDMPFPCKAVCNPGACLVNGEVVLLLRVIDDEDHSRLHVARSADGVGGWRIETTPLLSPDRGAAWYDNWGCEDPRLTYLTDRGEYVIAYVGWSRYGAGVCLATTKDFTAATRLGLAIPPYNKDASLLPRKIGGQYQMLHRPTAGPLENIWISESEDLIHWGNHRCVLEEDDQPSWNSGKVGAGPPLVETPEGWLLVFHGVQPTGSGWEYRAGVALLDKDDPSQVLMRWPEWVLSAQEPHEFSEEKGGIIFPTGLIVKDDQLLLYYGGGDTSVCLASVSWDTLRSFGDEVTRTLVESGPSDGGNPLQA